MKKILLSGFLLLFVCEGLAQDTGSGLDFLNIGPSARLLAVSEATTASLTGASAIYTNPALLVLEPSSSVDVNYTLWVAEITNQFAAVNYMQKPWATAIGFYSSRSDDFERQGVSGSSTIQYLSIAGAVAYHFGPFAAGVTGKYIREEILDLRGNGYAFNAGINTEFFNRRVRTGIVVKNVGRMKSPDIKSTPLPATFNAGVAASIIEVTTPRINDLPILLSVSADWTLPIEERSSRDFTTMESRNKGFFSLALYADFANLFSLQGGYRFGSTERPTSFGAGIIVDPIRVNYALIPFSTGFDTVHSFGLQFFF